MRDLGLTHALILAAGVGSRLEELSAHYPKTLVKVNGREILDYQLKAYLNAGVREENIHIVVGYKAEQVMRFLQANYPLVNVIRNENFSVTNNMFSLYLALKELLKVPFERLLINNADCIYDEALVAEFVDDAAKNAIAAQSGCYNEESMKLSGSPQKLTNIAKTTPKEESFGVSCDLYKFSREAVEELFEVVCDFVEVKKQLNLWSEVAFVPLFERVNVRACDIKGRRWFEIDNKEDLANACALFSDFDITRKKALICDMDGTLYVGERAIEEAIKFVKETKGLDFYFLTNNTSKTPQDYAAKLASFGINASLEQILTPLYTLIDFVKNEGLKSVYLVANERVSRFVQEALPNVKFEFDKASNEAVVLTYDTQLSYDKLSKACELLANESVRYIATHEDIFCPCEFGKAPDIGSFIALLNATTNRRPQVVLGKPSPLLCAPLVARYGKESLAVVGDRLTTDKRLAQNLDCDFVLVLTGETTWLDLQKQERFKGVTLPRLTF